jgi:hypothetical protein
MITHWPSCLYFTTNIRQQNSCFQSLSHWYKVWGSKHQLWARNNSDVPSTSSAVVRRTFSCTHTQLQCWPTNLILRGRCIILSISAYPTPLIACFTSCSLTNWQIWSQKYLLMSCVILFSLSVLSGNALQIYKLSLRQPKYFSHSFKLSTLNHSLELINLWYLFWKIKGGLWYYLAVSMCVPHNMLE